MTGWHSGVCLLAAIAAFSGYAARLALRASPTRRLLRVRPDAVPGAWRFHTIGEGVSAADRWPVQLAARLRDEVYMENPIIIATTGWTTDELAAAIERKHPQGPSTWCRCSSASTTSIAAAT